VKNAFGKSIGQKFTRVLSQSDPEKQPKWQCGNPNGLIINDCVQTNGMNFFCTWQVKGTTHTKIHNDDDDGFSFILFFSTIIFFYLNTRQAIANNFLYLFTISIIMVKKNVRTNMSLSKNEISGFDKDRRMISSIFSTVISVNGVWILESYFGTEYII
jgi:hypothetical protein